MNFDLSKMKKISHDEKSATFKHPDGHTLKIATASLSEKMKKQLGALPVHEQKMAEGGDAEPEEYVPGKDYKEAAKTGKTESPAPVNINIGTPATPGTPAQPEPNSSGASGPEFHAAGANSEPAWYDPDAPVEADKNPRTMMRGEPVFKNEVQNPQQAQPPEQAQPLPSAQPDMAAPQPEPVQASAPAQPQAAVQPQVQAQPAVKDPKKIYSEVKASQEQESQALFSDLQNGHITPETYRSLSGKGHLGKIGTIFGLLLSGAGSGLSGQPNALLAMMDKEIDRDLEAQKTNQQNKFNLYNISKKQLLENAQIAHINFETEEGKKKLDILTKNDAKQKKLAIDFHHLKETVDNIPDSDSRKAAAVAQLGRVYSAVQDKISNLQDINAGIAAASANSIRPTTKAQEHVDTDYAKSYNEWTSTGKANIDSNIKNLEDAKKALQKNPSLSGGLTGVLPDRLTSNDVLRQRQLVRSAIMGSLRQILGAQFTENEGERIFNTVYNEKADAKVNLKSISDYLNKLKNIRSENDAKSNYYEKNGSLTGFKAGNDNYEAAIAWANAHPEDPRSKTIMSMVKGR